MNCLLSYKIGKQSVLSLQKETLVFAAQSAGLWNLDTFDTFDHDLTKLLSVITGTISR
jgi:hypothetical protein